MKLITVFSSIYLVDVYLAKSILDNAEIESNILDANIVSMAPHYSLAISGVKLVIRDNDFSVAKEIIDDFIQKTKRPLREKVLSMH